MVKNDKIVTAGPNAKMGPFGVQSFKRDKDGAIAEVGDSK